MTTTFTWFPDVGATNKTTPKVSVSRFGDGYEQRAADGINSVLSVWSLTFTRDYTTAMAIVNFLKATAGASVFNWTNPNGVAGYYVCREWGYNRQNGEGVMSVTCSFEETIW